MANIGNNQVTAGVDGAVIGGISIANTQAPLPTTIFSEDVVLDNPASAFTIPQNYTFAIVGGIRANGVDATTGFLAADGAQIQVRDMPNRGFLNADFPLGFNGATFQFVNTSPERVRWPENAASGRLPFDGRNTTIIGQSVDVYSAASLSGLASNTADAFLFHLGAGDTGTAFDRTGTLLADDLQGHFNGVSLDGISFAGAITLQVPADLDYISVVFPDYNKVVAAEINNLRITAPKGGARRTMIKDGVLPFGTGVRAQAADARVVIFIGDAGMFTRYQNPSSYGTTPTFTETYSQIVTGGVNQGIRAGLFWRGYGWKPRYLDVVTGLQIEDGFIDFNLPTDHFVIQPSDDNQVIPPMIATDASGAISHTVTSNDNMGYWIITDSENPEITNITPNIDTEVVYTPATPYFMEYLVEANTTPIHVPTGATVESFDETRTQDIQLSADALAGTYTFGNVPALTNANTNATEAYAVLKRANRDNQTGPWGEVIDTSTNGAGGFTTDASLFFSDGQPISSINSLGSVILRIGSTFDGGLNDGATHTRWTGTQVTLDPDTMFDNIALTGTTSINIRAASAGPNLRLNSPSISAIMSPFPGTIEDGSTLIVGPNQSVDFEGATFEGTVTVSSNEIGGTDFTANGNFTGTLVAGTGVNNIIIPVLYTVEPSLIAGTNGFFAIRNLTTVSTVVDVTILNGVIQGNSFFEVDATSTDTYIAFYKLDSSITGDQVYRVRAESFTGTGLSRNTLIAPLTVPAPFTSSAIAVRPDGDGGNPVTMSYLQSGNTLIGTWVNNTSQPTRPNAFQTMTAVIDASNSAAYFNWMESRALTIDPTDYSSDGATVFNNSVTGLSGLSTNDAIRWNSEQDTGQSQVSQANGFFSDNVTGVIVQQILSFDIGNAPLGTVSAALAPQLAALPTASELDTLGDELKQNQVDLGAAFGDPTSAGKGVNPITPTNLPE